ncbi:uncharacterized protein LOC130966891 [Arachis stenosperma]|uniref:uncharacterized protein LOC130966891 n=1 Tax=Arachis stenosperma TaxID=217475 RepID=UPI0025AC2181|nr:uncharacterized protein LOC130966891 [Arachis stenosperma]
MGDELIRERLDRFLVGDTWRFRNDAVMVRRLTENGSDHAPLSLDIDPPKWKSKRCFKFQERCCEIDEVKNLISEALSTVFQASPMFCLAQKLKLCLHRMVQWQQQICTNSKKEIEKLTMLMEQLHEEGNHGGNEIIVLENRLKETLGREEKYWKEKSRCKWLKEGDKNTKFFHHKF